MRRRISESNIFPKFDLFEECKKINCLISGEQIIGTYNSFGEKVVIYFTLEEYVNQLYFTGWNLRGTFLSIDEMRDGLGITKEIFESERISEDTALDFCQYAANINMRVKDTISKCRIAYIRDENYLKMIDDNLTFLLERLGAHFMIDPKTREIFIVYNDELSSVVASDFPEIKHSLAEYKKIDNRGDLKRKGEILCTFFKRLEMEEAKLKGTSYKGLYENTTFLFNTIGARHWVEEDKVASKTFMLMSPAELEKWYDKTFDMFLSCMVISRYLAIKGEIEAIRRVK